MRRANWHTYQVLTKRSERMRDLLRTACESAAIEPHIWWGVSVENRRHGLPRIDHLRDAPAAVRFLSVEPLLEDLGRIDLEGIHWVIVGGESGPGARPMQPDWVRTLRDQCRDAGVPFFFKQWGGTRKKRRPRARRPDPRRDAPLGRRGGHEPRGSPRGHRPGRPPGRRPLTRGETRRVTCPEGKSSVLWQPGRDRWGNEVIHTEFARRECLACAAGRGARGPGRRAAR